MSKPKVFEKPIGLKDYLPHAVTKLRQIENQVLNCMASWGYEQIMTPTMEYYDTVGVASSTSDQKLFKLLNNRGTTLVLRSDMTAPIARVVSSLLQESEFPIRLSYHSNIFRAIEEEAGREAEFFQTGVELVGDASAEADAEVVALAIASLKAAGVKRFKIAIGHVGFLNGLFGETLEGRAEAQEELKGCLLGRDYVGYREKLRELSLSEPVQRELEGILRLRGGQEICDQALQLSKDETAQASIRHLCEMWDVLTAYGVCEHVMIDLTMIGDFKYYTGMTFEGYAADLGFPVASGGRYDNLLKQFGRPAPATGFAIKTTRILELIGDGEGDKPERERILIGYDASGRAEALAEAQRLRVSETAVIVTEKMDTEAQRRVLRAAVAAITNDVVIARETGDKGKVVVYKGVPFTKLLTFFANHHEQGGSA
ncbi:ATP phosphoribosyltransferase regulatory subunit [Paenibacillus baekrokdamisoli]|uniref:ATP phosphoribosyltransferase regulatory subunit n=1 Tax=Paenibacillus baekrokdamisoli TaxID=1712516 RepID=A0A3G9IX91_9BACL|nr:ATP phosphoribosyltransferase regulatory subunit [Paenibacillus baekrokdamisoli]MBB3067812.1 ATP phosphoribosyltransferase regulatory subunit [Paenibacillus baekrokdamisoli]BBH23146.1 ATP phosphoribosyltransferase regulatory subunit [Paenibacillus baekrokdamisoli]